MALQGNNFQQGALGGAAFRFGYTVFGQVVGGGQDQPGDQGEDGEDTLLNPMDLKIIFFSLFCGAATVSVTIGTRQCVIVDKGCGKVGDQYGKGHCVRVVAPGANNVDQDADRDAVDQVARGC